MDDADRAAELSVAEERAREAMMGERREKFTRQSLSICQDCDDPIPEARRALGGVTRCIDCQEEAERHGEA